MNKRYKVTIGDNNSQMIRYCTNKLLYAQDAITDMMGRTYKNYPQITTATIYEQIDGEYVLLTTRKMGE